MSCVPDQLFDKDVAVSREEEEISEEEESSDEKRNKRGELIVSYSDSS